MSGLNGGRVNIASCSLGGASQALSLTTQYLKEREAFQKKLIDFQVHSITVTEWCLLKDWSLYIIIVSAV